MNKDAQRITIAEACGLETHWPNGMPKLNLPDYLNDLNAMHEAEKVLNPEQEEDYVHSLGSLIMSRAYENDERWTKSNLSSFDSTYRATASQRAEAFLKTIGKWEEEGKR